MNMYDPTSIESRAEMARKLRDMLTGAGFLVKQPWSRLNQAGMQELVYQRTVDGFGDTVWVRVHTSVIYDEKHDFVMRTKGVPCVRVSAVYVHPERSGTRYITPVVSLPVNEGSIKDFCEEVRQAMRRAYSEARKVQTCLICGDAPLYRPEGGALQCAAGCWSRLGRYTEERSP